MVSEVETVNLKTTFVLMIVFMVVGSFAFFDPFGWEAKKEENAEKEDHVIWVKDKKIQSFRITKTSTGNSNSNSNMNSSGNATDKNDAAKNADKNAEKTGEASVVELVCKKTEGCPFDGTGDWDLKSPVSDLADPSSVGSLASAILNMTYIEKVDFAPGELNPIEFGLGRAQVEMQLVGEAKPRVLVLGGSAPAGPNVYIQNQENPQRLYVVASFFSQMLEKDVFHWRNKRVLPDWLPEEVTQLQFRGKTSASAKKENGKWTLSSSVTAPGNSIQWEGLVSTIVYLNAKSVLAGKSNAGKLELTVEIEGRAEDAAQSSGPKKKVLQFFENKGSKSGEWILWQDSKAYLVEAYPLERFRKSLVEYRERRMFPNLVYADLEKVRFQFPREKSEIQFVKEKDDWNSTEKTEALSQIRIRTFLQRLMDMEAQFFVPESNQGAKLFRSQPADLVVEIQGKGFQEKRSFLVVGRKSALTEGPIATELSSMSEAFLKWMPIRKSDFYEANNKTVVPEGVKEEEQDGHDHSHGTDPHHGHQH